MPPSTQNVRTAQSPWLRGTVPATAAAGVALSALALLVSSASVERAFVGSDTGTLAWGPDLFRLLLFFHGVSLVALAALLTRRRRPESAGLPDAGAGLPASLGPAQGASSGSGSSALVWAAVSLLTLVAFALRLWRLETDLWLDEVLTVVDFLRLPLPEIVATFPSQNQHPLYSVLGRIAIVAFGESAFSARLPAVLFGVGTIPVLFMLGRRAIGTVEALLACALMTFSYHHVWFSQNARGYSGLLFFSTLATWLWIEALAGGRARHWAGYSAAVCLGLWIHMTMIFVVAAHGLVYLALIAMPTRVEPLIARGSIDARYRGKALLAWTFAGTLALQLHALALPEFLGTALHEASLDSEWVDPLWVVRESIQRLADGGLATLVVAGGLLTLGWGLASLARRDWTAAAALALPGPLGGATMLALGHNLWPRFFFFCMGFLLLLDVLGVIAISSWTLTRIAGPVGARLAKPLGAAAWLVIVGASAWTIPRAYLPKQDFSGARAYIEQERHPDDEVVAVGLAGFAYSRLYAPEWRIAEDAPSLDAIEQGHDGVWLVYTLPVHLRAWLPDVWSAIQAEYEVVRIFPGTLGDGDVVVCKWRGDRQS